MQDPTNLIQTNFEEWYLKLSKYANSLLRRKVLQGVVGGVPPNGEEGEDIVLRVFGKLASGDRTWNQEKFPDLLPVLFKMVKSEIWNITVFEGNAFVRKPFFNELDEIHSTVEEAFGRMSHSPLTEVQIKQIEDISGEIISKLISAVESDAELNKLLEMLLDDLKPADISLKMEKTDAQIAALRKKLDRRLWKIIETDYSGLIADEKEK
jgi:hypothetical protein